MQIYKIVIFEMSNIDGVEKLKETGRVRVAFDLNTVDWFRENLDEKGYLEDILCVTLLNGDLLFIEEDFNKFYDDVMEYRRNSK